MTNTEAKKCDLKHMYLDPVHFIVKLYIFYESERTFPQSSYSLFSVTVTSVASLNWRVVVILGEESNYMSDLIRAIFSTTHELFSVTRTYSLALNYFLAVTNFIIYK
jgi:hypothetical protein